MKIVAVKIRNHWYRAASVLPVIAEYYPLFPVGRLRSETHAKIVLRHNDSFNDIYKYAVYNMKTKQFYNLQKPE